DLSQELNAMGATDKRQAFAISIALQTRVLKSCPVHGQVYLDEDADPATAFALAMELIRKQRAYAQEFHNDEHELTELLSDTLGVAPICCPECQSPVPSEPWRRAAIIPA
ncbi:MAG TPA: hypothetical protein VGD63_08060, partial [Steroidobacteraceae bacterium]